MDKTPEQEAFDFTIANPEKSTSECYIAGRSAGLEREKDLLGLSNSWPLADVLHELKTAANVLLNRHNYDGHRHEEISKCVKRAEEILQLLKP